MSNILFFEAGDKYNHDYTNNDYKNNEYNKGLSVSGDIITEDGRRKLLEKIQELHSKKPSISAEIQEAKDNGGIEENEEFTMALERLSRLEYDISVLQNVVENYIVVKIPPSGIYDCVKVGLSVTILNTDTEREVTYQLLGEYESDPRNGVISIKSPLGKELLGCKVGDYVELERGDDFIEYKVLKIFSK